MIISLTGFMGSGKSSVAKALGSALGCGSIDLDEVIESLAARRISEIFENEGEKAFREMESEVLADSVRRNEDKELVVIALGGGTLLDKANLDTVKNNTRCIFLKASVQTLWERLMESGCSSTRPLLKDIDREGFEALLESRSSSYSEAACLTVDTEGRSIEDICSEIIRELKLFA